MSTGAEVERVRLRRLNSFFSRRSDPWNKRYSLGAAIWLGLAIHYRLLRSDHTLPSSGRLAGKEIYRDDRLSTLAW